jgi:hypothetical protein
VGIPSFILQRLHRVRAAVCQRSIETDVPGWSLAYGAEGTEILVGHEDGIPRLWDATHFTLAREFVPHDGPVIAIASRGTGWATACTHGKVRIWGGFGEPKREFRNAPGEPELACYGLSWNREGTRLLTGHEDCTVRVYDADNARRLKKMHSGFAARAVAFGPEDVQVAITDGGGAIMWEGDRESPSARFPIGEPRTERDGYISLGFSRDRRMIAAAVHSDEIHLTHWNEPVCVLRGHTDLITSLAWSPEGRFLLSGSEDCTARIWDTTTRDCVVTINDVACIRAVAFHPHGHDCATLCEDGTLRIYELDSEWFDLRDAVEQAAAAIDGRKNNLWPTKAPLDLDFVLDVWTDVRRRGRHSKVSNELAEKGEQVRRTTVEILQLLCGESSPNIPRTGIERYKHPLFRVALADMRLATELCQRLGGDAAALQDLQRTRRVPTTEVMASGLSIMPPGVAKS